MRPVVILHIECRGISPRGSDKISAMDMQIRALLSRKFTRKLHAFLSIKLREKKHLYNVSKIENELHLKLTTKKLTIYSLKK